MVQPPGDGVLAATVAALARHPDVADRRPALAALIERTAETERDDRELATMLIALGDLGGSPQAWLDHGHFGVRASAAPVAALSGNAGVRRLRAETARSPEACFGILRSRLRRARAVRRAAL